MVRKLLPMDDPVFTPGITKTARAPVTISPGGLSCQAELFLATSPTAAKAASSGLKPFSSTGSQQIVSLPVTMPAVAGAIYKVYLDVYVEGYLLLAYVATEDVIIPSGSVGPITWE